MYKSNYTDSSDAWFFTRGVNLVAGDPYRVNFKYGNNSSSGKSDKLEVKCGMSCNAGAMNNLIANYPDLQMNGAAAFSSNLFTPVVSGTYYFGFHAYSPQGQNSVINIDDIFISKANTLLVSAFEDLNGNLVKDPSESYFPNANIITAKGLSEIIFSNSSSGVSRVYVDTGKYITKPIPYTSYFTSSPTSHQINFNSYNNIDSVSFALQIIPGQRDLAVSLVPLNIARAGLPLSYRIVYKNVGTDTIANARLKLVKSNLTNFIASLPVQTSVSGDTITWNVSNIYPQYASHIDINLNVSAPPITHAGDILISTVSAVSDKQDQAPGDNTSSVSQVIRTSYDPNDKSENHGGKITYTAVAAGDFMQYTVRFQNTGNDTAFNIFIRDTLDSKLDWSTLQMVAASHGYQMIMNDGKCQWTFSNINLADSSINEPASHGYLVYKIKPKANVSVGNVISNKAAIYFDYNLPVFTNTEITSIVSETLPLKLLSFTARRSSSSFGADKILLNWMVAQEANVEKFEIERRSNGQAFNKTGVVKAVSAREYSYTDHLPETNGNELTNNLFYRLKMTDRDGTFYYSPVRTIYLNSFFNISIHPNPARDKLQLRIDSDRKLTLRIQIISPDGKVLLGNEISVQNGSAIHSIDISSLQKGTYFIRVNSIQQITYGGQGQNHEEESVIKFEKL